MINLIKRYKKEYYLIGYIKCNILSNEKIYFNNYGFNHLIRKRGLPRSKNERIRRLQLIKIIPKVLKLGKFISFKKTLKMKFWSIKYKNHTVILRKIGRGKLHFYSVFNDR